jgi:hypothetical protein
MDLHSCKSPPDKSKGTGLIISQAVRFRSQFIDSIVGFYVASLWMMIRRSRDRASRDADARCPARGMGVLPIGTARPEKLAGDLTL